MIYPSMNYMKIFLTDPTLMGSLYIDEIKYINEFDSFQRFLVVLRQIRYDFRPNQLIVGFISNSNIYEEDRIKILIYSSYLKSESNLDRERILMEAVNINYDSGYI